MNRSFLIYGANGYTGELTARMAVASGSTPILAGRRAEAILPLAQELGLDHVVCDLDDSRDLDKALHAVDVVIHCAGPFSKTSARMVDACLRTKTHYLDITGEIDVFEATAKRDSEACEAGVALLPGAGFDVVPSDCLAAYVASRASGATSLSLGFQSTGGVSRGTATTMIQNLHRGGAVRRNGEIVRVPAAWKTRQIDFGRGPRGAMTIPWGDVATAYYTTGIPNIEVFVAAPRSTRITMRIMRVLAPLMSSSPIQRLLIGRVRSGEAGPNAELRQRARSYLWAEASADDQVLAVARLETPEGYTLTAMTSLAIARRMLDGDVRPGFNTPAGAYGADFILELDGVVRRDVTGD